MIKTINRTYRFRIYPKASQLELLAKHFGCTRFIYNYFLNQRQEQYKEKGYSDNYYAQAKVLTELKKQEEMETSIILMERLKEEVLEKQIKIIIK